MAASSGLAPVVSVTGISAGTYSEWLAYFIAQYQSIFGADVYLGNDSQDFQLMSVFALACADQCAAAIAVYNSFSPTTAQGVGLSSVVKINGLTRLVPTASTALLTIVGTAGVVITNGVAIDNNSNLWNLPPSVTIPTSASITVTVTAQNVGAISAAPGSINRLSSPVLGVVSVSNAAQATPGSPVETDAQLRVRQAASVANPSQSIFAGMLGAVRGIPGITRVRGIENATSSATGDGVPARSMDFIVEGGTSAAIAAAIAARVPPGTQTYGTTSVTITDPSGSTRVVSFEVATPAPVTMSITIKPLAGWAASTETLISAALAAYIQALPIGSNISYTQLLIPAYLIGTPYFGTFEITSLSYTVSGGSAVSSDTQLPYNNAATMSASAVTYTVTS